MAKSIRSKRRRKMRAVKREKFGKKELERLKGMVERAKAAEDVDMKEMFTEKDAGELKQGAGEEMDTSKGVKKYNPVSMRDQNGSYPVWMNHRKIRSQKKFEKRKLKAIAKKKKQK